MACSGKIVPKLFFKILPKSFFRDVIGFEAFFFWEANFPQRKVAKGTVVSLEDMLYIASIS